MEKKFEHKDVEKKIYEMWEKGGYFGAKIDKTKTPYTIVLPPPNASGKMHTGNVLMIAIEDILIRWKRMKGYNALWVPGIDHAGTETQITFERELKKQGKSRFDYDRNTLYEEIWKFVQKNKSLVDAQIRSMGASIDWSRYKFTLDSDVLNTVCETFEKLYAGGLIYKDDYIVNYCPVCGTTYADIEIDYKERTDPFYYIKYGPFVIGTVRPETKFRDTALAVNPKDKKYKEWIGKTLEIPSLLGNITMTIISDPDVDPKFGTGIMKVTPAHDPHDFELGKKYNLPVTPIITTQGRMDFAWFLSQKNIPEKYRLRAEKYHHQKVAKARALMVEDLKEDGLLVKTNTNYTHRIGTCYRDGSVIEPLPLEQWFIKVKPLVAQAKKLVKTGKIKVHPKRFEKHLFRILDNFIDWNISRQIVWGIRIPAWQCEECTNWTITKGELPKHCSKCKSIKVKQDEDTFDTWFSSAQWPFATIKTQGEQL